MTYTTTEAAKELGVTPRRVQQAVKRFRLGRRERPGHPIYLSKEEVEIIRDRIGKRGRAHWLNDV